MSPSGAETGELSRSISIVGLALLSFLAGMTFYDFGWFPTDQVERGFDALRAHLGQKRKSPYETSLWYPARFDTEGVSRQDDTRRWGEFTLYTSSHVSGAFLIDASGKTVHRWELPFHEAWPDPSHVDNVLPEKHVHWRNAHLFPNGDVLAIYEGVPTTPYGYGLVKVDRDSNLLWRFSAKAHHDFEVVDSGDIYALVQEFRNTDDDPVPGLAWEGEKLVDSVVRLSSGGERRQTIPLVEAFMRSNYQGVLADAPATWDVFHTNSIRRIDEDFAEHHAFAEPGQLLLSFRTLNALAILDVRAREFVWFQQGMWMAQHDAEPLPDGEILLFDNRGNLKPANESRVLRVAIGDQPPEITWQWPPGDGEKLLSKVRGSQQLLPNGNVLVTESESGRLVEVTEGGDVVWEFVNPVRRRRRGKSWVPTVNWGRRYERSELNFE